MAMTNAARFLAGAALALFGLGGPALAQQKLASIFTVASVRAGAEAANAVEAKRLATEAAQSRAFRMLVSRLADFRTEPRIPVLSSADLERLISDIDVRGEGVSGTSYVATFGITFSERSVAALFAQYGVVPIADRGPEFSSSRSMSKTAPQGRRIATHGGPRSPGLTFRTRSFRQRWRPRAAISRPPSPTPTSPIRRRGSKR